MNIRPKLSYLINCKDNYIPKKVYYFIKNAKKYSRSLYNSSLYNICIKQNRSKIKIIIRINFNFIS